MVLIEGSDLRRDEPASPEEGLRLTVDRLLDEHWTDERPQSTRRETIGEGVLAAAFAILAVAFASLGSDRPVDVAMLAAFVAAYAGMASILFHVGAGYGVPTQLVLVPMLLLAPVALVPLLVAAGLVLSTLPGVLRRREPPQRLVSAVGDAWYALAPAAVLLAAGEPGPAPSHIPLFAAAFLAQAGGEGAIAIAREWATRGIHPRDQVGVLGMVQAVDLLLWPVGLAAAVAGERVDFAWLLVLPQGVLLGLLARDRAAQIAVAQDRLTALRRERTRFTGAVRRVGAAFASTLDREALLALTLETAKEAVHGQAAAILDGASCRVIGEATDELADTLTAVADRARSSADLVIERRGGSSVVGCAVRARVDGDPVAALAFARAEPFGDEEQELLASLMQQAGVSVENVELHARLRRQAASDSLTGLANHRTLQEHLASEVERARRGGGDLALLLVDVDDFKAINDVHGHLEGDHVIRHVAARLGRACRADDLPARYGGEEFAVVLPGAGSAEAMRVAERVRVSVAQAPVVTALGDVVELTVSIGAAWLDGTTRDPRGLLAAADVRLYEAKRAGKNRVVAR